MQWIFILAIGLTCTIGGAAWGLKRLKLRCEGTRTLGTVVEISTTMDIPRSHYPIIEFKTDAGQTIKFRGSTGSTSPSYQPDQLVRVIYSRQNPWNAQIDDFEHFWLGPVSIGIFGLIALGAFLIFGKL